MGWIASSGGVSRPRPLAVSRPAAVRSNAVLIWRISALARAMAVWVRRTTRPTVRAALGSSLGLTNTTIASAMAAISQMPRPTDLHNYSM